MIAGVVLAAGRGERFGSDKLLRELGGRPLICRTLANCAASSLDGIVVVVGGTGGVEAAIRSSSANEPRLSLVHNLCAARGHLSSVKTGLRALPDGTRAAVVFLGDMPFVSAAITERLIEAHRRTGGFVVPVCEDTWRHPRVIPAARFADFLSLDDGASGGVVFERFREEVLEVEVGQAWNFLDVDTEDDLARAQRLRRP